MNRLCNLSDLMHERRLVNAKSEVLRVSMVAGSQPGGVQFSQTRHAPLIRADMDLVSKLLPRYWKKIGVSLEGIIWSFVAKRYIKMAK